MKYSGPRYVLECQPSSFGNALMAATVTAFSPATIPLGLQSAVTLG